MRKRPAARLFLLDENNHILLFRYDWTLRNPKLVPHWATPGGALEAGETYAQAAQREAQEETGLSIEVGDDVFRCTVQFQLGSGERVEAHERYYFVRTHHFEIDSSLLSHPGSKVIKSYRWWTLQELSQTKEVIYPEQISEVINQILASS